MKVRALCDTQVEEQMVQKILNKRNITSLSGYTEFSRLTELLNDSLKLLKVAGDSEFNEMAKGLMDSFLGNRVAVTLNSDSNSSEGFVSSLN